jgi:hypothetical protein
VAFLQELAGMICLYSDIVLIRLWAQPDFLKRSEVLSVLFVRQTDFAFLLVEPFAVIHYSAYGRVAVGRDFDEIQTDLACFVERLGF